MVTFKGRVVYHRKYHRMTYADVARIAEKVNPGDWSDISSLVAEIASVFRTILAAERDFLSIIARLPWSSLPTKLTIELVMKLLELVGEIMGHASSEIVSGVVDRIASQGLKIVSVFGSPSETNEKEKPNGTSSGD